MKKTLIIPDRSRLDASLELAKKYNLGFEYNDFFSPRVMDNPALTDEITAVYKSCALPDYCTNHGDFFDVLIFSDDERIRVVSEERIAQSIAISKEIGAKGVVFHTNHNPALRMPSYIKNWLDKNVSYWSKTLEANPDINIYIENMFDIEPSLLASLAAELRYYDNFGVCFDYAHAAISPTPLDNWVSALSPYVKHIHINDNDLRSDLHLALGDGRIDWKAFEIHRCNFMPDATVLIETTPIENQIASLKYLEEHNSPLLY